MIGTSAGGLYALLFILEKLPSDYALPIIVVQHRSKDRKELLEEILQSKLSIKIKQADEKENIRGGVVYIAPPDYHLLIEEDQTFSLTTDNPVRFSRPSIDVMFESAAYAYKEHLLGIILTGANSDGAAGIELVSDCGGTTIAQHPLDAQFATMPEAAIKTGKISHIYTLKEIQQFLLKITDTK